MTAGEPGASPSSATPPEALPLPEGMAVALNWDLIRSRIADIRDGQRVLRRYAGWSEAEFLQNEEAVRSAKYSLIVIFEAMAAICSHVAARLLRRAPDSYAGCFELLAEAGILPDELARRLTGMARLRNPLVHGYQKVDDRTIHRHLPDGLDDLDRFVEAVEGLREKGGEEHGG